MNVDENAILEACGQLIDLHAWPSEKIDPYGWLENFTPDERPYALHILSRFMFFADHLVDRLFAAAFQTISNRLTSTRPDFEATRGTWEKFCSEAVITYVQGERPHPTDSGLLFARKVRQHLGFPEHALLTPEGAVAALLQGYQRPIVFVDDFIGSGDQFNATWTRPYQSAAGTLSFEQLEQNGFGSDFFVCAAISTESGRACIADQAPRAVVCAGNVIPDAYSLVSPHSVLWTDEYREKGIEVIRKASTRIACTSDGGIQDWRGYRHLGLGLAFAHSTPDATLPLFHSEANGWRPLVKRS